MSYHFDLLKRIRANFLNKIADLTTEQLNHTPEGLGNNIAWNLGHLVATQQLLCYRLAGVPCRVSDAVIDKYRKGTAPTEKIEAAEIEELKKLLIDTIEWTIEDFNNGLFKNYKTYPTSFGVTLTSSEDALSFNNIHEGMHYGNVIVMEKLV